MITREQVADLREGDIVEMSWACEGGQITIRGPLWGGRGEQLSVAGYWVRESDGAPVQALGPRGSRTLTVISRAPQPLYVNHDRSEPVPGDVVRDADSDDANTWVRNRKGFSYEWLNNRTHDYVPREKLPDRLRLLVDGTTGEVVR